MTASYLFDLAETLLDRASDALDVSRTGNPNPKRQFVSMGAPVADQCCEHSGQLTVHLAGFQEDGYALEPKSINNKCVLQLDAHYWVTLFRCYPAGVNPQPAELNNASERLYKDQWALMDGLKRDWCDIVPDGCDMVRIGLMKVLTPQGGCAGFAVEIVITLSDPDPITGS